MDQSQSSTSSSQSVQLVDMLNRKDPASASLLQQLHREPLIRFCRGYLNRIEETEDAVQEILIKVLQAPAVPIHFRAWLYKIARNHCLKCLRGRSGRDGPIHQPSQIPEVLTGQLTRMIRDEAQHRLSEAFASLSDEQREVLRLRYGQDLSRAEIAEILDVSESVVKSRLFEGLKKLRDEADRLGTP